MRALLIVILGVFILAAPSLSYADIETVADDAIAVVKENPGKSAGVAGCGALLIFPPAAVWCAATLLGGATIDGDVQEVVEKVVE
jgi:hypothetical protein|tara:strand:- start:241 stop:495 length:255 start_codon:yes stop_codon:yes gene_type:complete